MRVVLLDVSLTWSEFLPVSLIDASADQGVQVHVVSQNHHFLIMVRNTRLYNTIRSSLALKKNPCDNSPVVYML